MQWHQSSNGFLLCVYLRYRSPFSRLLQAESSFTLTLESRIIVYTRSMYFEKFPRFTVLFGTYTEPLSRRKILTFHLFLRKFSFEISLHNYIVHNGLVYIIYMFKTDVDYQNYFFFSKNPICTDY